jgi:tRNA A-37 threonylcarbamoyl transferase component Bud32
MGTGGKLPSGQTKSSVDLEGQIIRFCTQIAHNLQISGACLCWDTYSFLRKAKTLLEVLLVIKGFKPGLMTYVKFLDDKPVIFYTVDKRIFEKDVENGFLGEALSVHLLFPYKPLIGKEYLEREEVKLKKRVILEALENLVLDFPELSHQIHIKPEYFMYETILSRARLFPPLYYVISNIWRGEEREKVVQRMMRGYTVAIKELVAKRVLEDVDGGFFKISKACIESFKSRGTIFKNLLKSTQRTFLMALLGGFPKILRALSENAVFLSGFRFFESEGLKFKAERGLEDPKKYLFVPTASGLASLASRVGVYDLAKKLLNVNGEATIEVEDLGGVLNDVYLIRVVVDGEERRIVVKSFWDWSGVKWFPLTLWTFGTRTFAVLGRSRLERECSINQLLYSNGFPVPRILGVNHAERLVFMEYLEGETLDKIVKQTFDSAIKGRGVQEKLKIFQKVGETIARVHSLNVALGDTKPENILISKNGEVCLMDFEQASRNGDKAWDIAELLYYVGHYAPPLAGTQIMEAIARAFIKGYLEAGGDIEAVRAAGKPKYTKVFSVFAFPHIILAISNICRKARVEELKNG